jgi:secreted trypsin-like serine protease
MAYNYIVFLFLFLYNIDFVSPIVYSCDRNIECGCSKTNADVGKIVGGESAINSSWGWAVSLQKSVNGHFCGGVIISSLDVITAAHCIEDPFEMIRNVKVVVGIDTLSQSGSSIAQVRSIVSVMSHPQYDKKSNANDIAVLRLNQPLNISNEKGTARLCLPHVVPIDTANNYPIPDSSLVAIGWGVLASEQISIPSYRHLRQVTLNTISPNHRMCKSVINDQKLQFCAGVIGGGKGKRMMISLCFMNYLVLS